MMRCHDVLDRLWDFLDGELDEHDETEVERHLELCSRCYPQYDFRRAHLELMRRLRDRDHVPRHVRQALFARILEQEGTAPAR